MEALTDVPLLLAHALPTLLRGTGYTLLFALSSMVLGLVLGALIAVLRIARVPLLSRLAVLYVSCMRGTPLLVQVFVIYYGLPSVGIRFDPMQWVGLKAQYEHTDEPRQRGVDAVRAQLVFVF